MPAVVVGDIDTGVNYTTQQEVWINQGEIPKSLRIKDVDGDLVITFKDLNGSADNRSMATDSNGNGIVDAADLLKDKRWANGADEDGNGYTDDLVGWNFANNTNDASDWNGHGTSITGAIVDSGKPSAYVVPILMIGPNAQGDLAKCVDYFTGLANAAKARGGVERFVATNNSYGGLGTSDTHKAAIGRAASADVLFVAAAGNDPAVNNDITPPFPASLSSNMAGPFDNVIAVTMVDPKGNISGNFGPRAVDVAVPGGTTSEASGRVAGTLAAFAAKWPDATTRQIKATMLSTVASTPSIAGKIVSRGVLNATAFLGLKPVASNYWPWGETFVGTGSSDTLSGSDRDDLLVGDPTAGRGQLSQVDIVTGGDGADMFVIGKGYAAGKTSDYLLITDFVPGVDKIGVFGSITDYRVSNFSSDFVSGAGVYKVSDGELLAVIKDRAASRIKTSTDFVGTVASPVTNTKKRRKAHGGGA